MNTTTAASEDAKSLRGRSFTISGEALEHAFRNIAGIDNLINSSAGTHQSEKRTARVKTRETLGLFVKAGIPVPEHLFPKRMVDTWNEPIGDVLQMHNSLQKRFFAVDHVLRVVKTGTPTCQKGDGGWKIECEEFVAKLVGQGNSIRLIYNSNSTNDDEVIVVQPDPRQLYKHLHELREVLDNRYCSEKIS